MEILINDFFGILATVFSFFTYFFSIKKSVDLCRKTELYTSLPSYTKIENIFNYIVCSSWLVYAALLNDKYLFCSFLIGTILFLFWIIVIYIMYLIRQHCFFYSILIFLGLLYPPFIYFLFHLGTKNFAGYFCMVIYLFSFIGPFLIIRDVIRTKNYNIIIVWFIILKLITHLSWLIYGFIIFNINIVIPNFIGVILSFAPLFFYNIYKKKYHSEKLSNRSVDIMRNRAEYTI